MKLTVKLLIPLFIASLFIFSSCSKEGDVGPMGPRGEQGIQGPEGPEGPAGQDGEVQETTASDESQAGGVVGGQDQEGEAGPKGDQGEQGPQGEAGENGVDGSDGVDGEDGTDGEDGVAGEDGEDGNANVIDSGWIPADFSSGRMRVANPNLTADMVNNSLIMVFGVWSDGEEYIFQFPHQIADEKFSFYLINEAPGTSFAINFLAQAVDGSPIEEVFRCDAVKYFLVPSKTVTGKSSNKNLLKMSYKEFLDHFGLEN